jgi:FG-GAP-like repeat
MGARRWLLGICFAAVAALALSASCGGDSGDGTASNAGGSGAGTGGKAGDASIDGSGGLIDSGQCPTGSACGDGGICTGGVCCDKANACADECCSSGQVCSFQKCATPGNSCTDSSDCAQGEYCDYSLGDPPDAASVDDSGSCVGGKLQPNGKCLPSPPICSDPDGGAIDAGAGASCLEKCEYHPPSISFEPVLKYSWGGQTTAPYSTDVMMTPIVVELDDDDCDGKVTQNDIPEIAFVTFTGGAYYGQGTLHVVSVVGGQVVEKWNKPSAVQGSSGLAAGDLDGDGVAEIVACAAPAPGGTSCCDAQAENTGVVAFKADGSVLWTQPDTSKVHCGYEFPAIGDPEHTGQPLVLVGLTLLDGKTGAVVKELDPSTTFGSHLTGLYDIDGDGKLDVIDGQRAYRTDGSVIWDLRTGADAIPFGYHAVGDLDKDGKPEVVVISSGGPHTANVISYDPSSPSGAKVVRKGIDINDGTSTASYCSTSSEYGGGPPTIADFDGDGFPDVGAAGAVGYVVLSGKKLMDPNVPADQTAIWFKTTHDCSSAVTGSAVFDFNGDGSAEVVYSDEFHLWMYDGKTGTNLIPSLCNTTGTLWEYPVVADVDNDGQADIVVASNAYAYNCPDDGSKQAGIRIFGSKNGDWVRTRRIWNEHTYHITNIDENGHVPQTEVANYSVAGLNDYRQNKQPGGEFAAPDAVVSVAAKCFGDYGLVATVRNIGQAVLPPGQTVTFYAGNPAGGTSLGQADTTLALGPAQSENVTLLLPNPPAGVQNGTTPVYATVTVNAPTVECRTDNDTSDPVSGECGVPK